MKTAPYRWNCKSSFLAILTLTLLVIIVLGCSGSGPDEEMIKNFAIDNFSVPYGSKKADYDYDFKITNKYTQDENGKKMFVYATEVTMKNKTTGNALSGKSWTENRRTGFVKRGNEWAFYILEP